MTPGQIVLVDWRDALPGSGEPNKTRPAVALGRADLYGEEFGHLLVVPLSTCADLAVAGCSVEIAPSPTNRCKCVSYALAWNVQCVPMRRVQLTSASIDNDHLDALREQIARLVER